MGWPVTPAGKRRSVPGRRWAAPLLASMVAGCGYFNALYNAERRFDDAERLRQDGQVALARSAYEESLLKAAASYRSHPRGRWADDALFLIGRAHFALQQDREAAAAMERVVTGSGDRRLRGSAAAYVGAASVRGGRPAQALAWLDTALVLLRPGDREAGFAQLWLGRARLGTGDEAGGWAALDVAVGGEPAVAREARLEAATHALASGDSARLAEAVAGLLADGGARSALDSVRALTAAEARRRGPRAAAVLLAPSGGIAWPSAARDSLRLIRAGHLAQVGDPAAEEELRALSDGAAGETARRARHAWARLRLERVSGLEELPDVRAILLPAVAHIPALRLVDHIRTVETLVARAGQGRPLALFMAAELSRDSLAAPLLASRLFAAYAELVPDGTWAGKALLAAASLAGPEEAGAYRAAAAALPPNPYSGGADALAFETAERTLQGQLSGLLQDARATARARDASVTMHVATLDSLRLAARTDSLRISCGARFEAAAVVGIRADSARAACVRADSARVAWVLALTDTLVLCDSLCPALPDGRTRPAGRDTFPPFAARGPVIRPAPDGA